MLTEKLEELSASRYNALKHWALEQGYIRFVPLSLRDSEPFVMGELFYGETFEDAVDSLPGVKA